MTAQAIDKDTLWIVIAGLAFGSFALRFGFLGFMGNRTLPAWLLRHLRYTAVGIIPALVTPLLVWPAATGGVPDLARSTAAFVTTAVGLWTKNVIVTILAGAATLAAMLHLVG